MNVYGWFMLAAIIILGIFVAINAIPKVPPVAENVSTSFDAIQDSIDKICEIDDRMYERLKDALSDDSNVQNILNQMDTGQMTTSCGYSMLNWYLDEESRKKIRWHEIVCDVNKCLE